MPYALPPSSPVGDVAYNLAVTVMYYAQDETLEWPALTLGSDIAFASQRGIDEGRTKPGKMPGFPPWKCSKFLPKMTCTTTVIGPERAWTASLKYTSVKNNTKVSVTVIAR